VLQVIDLARDDLAVLVELADNLLELLVGG
jgi:hypothetical protein